MSMHEIDLSRTDLNLLVVFDALMKERHVGRAAARLSLSQSATSHALGRLRNLLGDQLFVRHPKGVVPTIRARDLAEAVADLLARARAIVALQSPFSPASLTRTFTIGATDYGVFVVLAPLLARIQTEAPGLDLRILPIDAGRIADDFDRGDLDFAIGNFPKMPHRIEALPLFAERFVGVVRRGHPGVVGGEMSLDTFIETPHALVSFRGDPHGRVDDALEPLGLRRRVAVTVAHFLAMPFVIGASDMVGVLAERAAVRMAETAELSLFQLPIAVPPWDVHLVRGRQLADRPEVQWFSNVLVGAQLMSRTGLYSRARGAAKEEAWSGT